MATTNSNVAEPLQTPASCEQFDISKERVYAVVRDIFVLAFPNILIFVLSNANDMISLIFIGRTGNADYISAVGMSNSVIGMVALQPLFAISVSVDTLVAQAFGKKDYRLCGQYLNKALTLLFLGCIPSLLCLFLSKSLLLAFGFEQSMASLVGAYTARMSLSVLSAVAFYMLNRFLNALQIVNPQMIIIAVTSVLHPLWCYLFIFAFDMGYLGLNYAYTITNVANLVLAVVYIYASGRCGTTLCRLDGEILRGWGEYLKIACASVFMAVLEWWGYYILMLFAGYLDTTAIATNQIIMSIGIFFYMVPTGIGSALTSLVGSKLGSRRPKEAKLYAAVSATLNMGITVVLILLFLIFRRQIAALYTSNLAIQDLCVKVLLLALVAILFDCAQGIMSRVFVAQGRQIYATATNLLVYYVYLIPCGYICVMKIGMSVYGLWFASASALAMVVATFLTILLRQDWNQLAEEACRRSVDDGRARDELGEELQSNTRVI